jgi:hypothetical protein
MSVTPSTASSSPTTLPGKYRTFFAPQHHATVSAWYHESATTKQRRDFKRIISAVLGFDASATYKRLAATVEPDIVTAHSVVGHNGGSLLAPVALTKCVEYMSMQPAVERQAFRATFGTIVPICKSIRRSHTKMEFASDTKFSKGERMHGDDSKQFVGREHIRPHSLAVEAPSEIIAAGKSHYSTFFVWKTAPAQTTNIQQRAHESSFGGAPWGEYGATSNKQQWTSQSTSDFEANTYKLNPAGAASLKKKADTPAPVASLLEKITGKVPVDASLETSVRLSESTDPRRFQNYNENFTNDMYKGEKAAQKARKLERSERRARHSGGRATAPLAQTAPNGEPPLHLSALAADSYDPVRRQVPVQPSAVFCR